jgi:hypothetical protein
MGSMEAERIRLLERELERTTTIIKERDQADVLALIAKREAEAAAKAKAQRAADQLVRDAEIEATRKAAWLLHLTDPGDAERYKQLVANAFSPKWIADNTPPQGWPEGDGPEMHRYDSVAPPVEPEDDGVVPPLVIRARQMGLDV